MCKGVHVCACVSMFVHECIHVCDAVYLCICVHLCVCVHVHIFSCAHVYECAFTQVCLCVHECASVCVCVWERERERDAAQELPAVGQETTWKHLQRSLYRDHFTILQTNLDCSAGSFYLFLYLMVLFCLLILIFLIWKMLFHSYIVPSSSLTLVNIQAY